MAQYNFTIFIIETTWEESVKRDLKDWSITKELTMDRAA
jgi:hypothetical protein